MKWRMGKVIGHTTAVALAVMFCVNSGRAGSSEHTCTECRQSYGYICLQNLGQCHSACRSIGTIDRDACARRCIASNDGCTKRAALKCGACEPAKYPTPPPARIQ